MAGAGARRPRDLLRAIGVNVLGAVVVVLFARANLEFYRQTHRLIGVLFIIQELCLAVAFLVRRPARSVTGRSLDWVAAVGGTFGGFLLRPSGLHLALAGKAGVTLQVIGLATWMLSFARLGRSFGLVAADRGLVTSGPYRLVRHPLYLAYVVTQFGYLLQSISIRNGLVLAFTWACQMVRATAEERHLLATVPTYSDYLKRVRWRLIPGVW